MEPTGARALSDPPVIYIISDSLGDSAATMAVAAASQFSEGACVIERLPKAGSLDQMTAFVEAHLEEAQGRGRGEMVLFHTIADVALRTQLEDYLADKPIAAADLIGPAIETIAEATGRRPKGEPGLIRKTDKEYFNRVGALEFAVDHDDGRNTEQLGQADIVLIGVSRSSKTPLAIYLATNGYRVANVPLAAGTEPPPQLFEIDPRRIFGLTSSPALLSEIRYRRLGDARGVAGAYADPVHVQTDLDEARQLMRRLGCIVVRTDNRAIEETAQEILRYYDLTYPSHGVPLSQYHRGTRTGGLPAVPYRNRRE
ncbi:MAG: kinase/pyrophosphorylase [Coriobacteriales bacterium]|jgi:regulator of PEP synthase PpsR (kinase-PPPase family)|nr:kinase/pyrophosphorylase [Coriobacteriales bacterium]